MTLYILLCKLGILNPLAKPSNVAAGPPLPPLSFISILVNDTKVSNSSSGMIVLNKSSSSVNLF